MNAYDLIYAAGIALSSPVWLLRPSARRKVLGALSHRMGKGLDASRRDFSRPAILIHAVSLGEINATRALVDRLRLDRPDLQFVITTTTATGYDRGLQLYGKDPDVLLIRYPLDFTPAIARVLDGLRVTLAVLIELELWPNFLRQCAKRRIPVILVNGRITPGSYRNYHRGRWLTRGMFGQLAALCAQDERFAEQFITLGADPQRVQVTGTMKFDTATLADRIEGDEKLAASVGLKPAEELIWVAGSTGPGEEALILPIYRHLLQSHPTLRLVIVPRKPERFDEVARLIESEGFNCIRRSQHRDDPQRPSTDNSQLATPNSQLPVILGDTMGELRVFYSLATIVFVGRTLVDLGHRQHGSDMIEPAALAKLTIVGPFTHNFADVMNKFRQAGALIEVQTPEALQDQLTRLLTDPAARKNLGHLAQQVVAKEQGATDKHARVILHHLPRSGGYRG